MGRGKELSPQLRSRLCELKSIGWNARRIHAHHPELSLNTIRSTLRREPERNNNASRPRSGRPAKLTDAHIERLRAVLAANPNANSRELLDQVDHVVQKRTIQRIVRDMMVAGRGSNPRQGQGQGNGQTVQRKRQLQIQRPRAALVSSPHNNGECGNAATVVTAAAAAVASGTPGASASPASSIQVPAPVSASTSASMPMVASTTPAAPAPSLSSPSGSAPASVPMPMPMPIQMPMQM